MDRIQAVLPAGRRLIEPFVGTGAVFLNTSFEQYLLTDNNPDLIRLYQYLQREGEDFVAFCRGFFQPETNQRDMYLTLRETFNTTTDLRLKSALFVYLNRHGFNGLCRYNSRGIFNVPFGQYDKPYFPESEMMAFYEKSQGATFLCQDFRTTMGSARPGDVLYCDPPYVPLNRTANFTGYTAGGFGLSEQQALADSATHLSLQGVPVVISNHNTEFTREAYQDARLTVFDVRRSISCNGANRGKVGELLAVFDAPETRLAAGSARH
jgi:DNA adenine methylase